MKLTLGLLCGLFFLPVTSEAATTAVMLSDTTALFTIEFSVTDNTFDQQIPIIAKQGVSYADRVSTLGYTIETSDTDSPSISVVNALVLSNSPVSGVRYQVPKDTEARFTLVILATFSEALDGDEYRARITKFPYWLEGRRTSIHQNQLDEFPTPILK